MISMIASVGKKRELGKKNGLIWRIKQDMQFFKRMTMGHTIVMGYNTYKSLPGDLPGRRIIVVYSEKLDGIETVNGIEPIIKKYKDSEEEVLICGGASIYSQFIDYAKKLYLTEIDGTDREADTFFPKFDKRKWKKVELESGFDGKIAFKMYEYTRRNI